MKVLFIHRFGPQFASYRYRAQMPSEELAKIGFTTGLNTEGDYDAIVFSKPTKDDVPLVEQAKRDGAKVLVDCSDDHFTDGQAETYHQLAGLADRIVVASDVMRNRVQGYVNKDAVVLPDPYEQPECEPHAQGDDFLWFGHTVNLKDITNVSRLLKGRNVRVVTGPKHMPGTIPWSPENLAEAFRLSNIALFPTSPGAEFKSANRVLNAVRAGLFPVCQPHPSYVEFRHLAWVGEFYTGLRWTDCFKADLNGLVKQAQGYIRERYSPETIGRQWAAALEAA